MLLTIIEANLARQKLYEEKSYLERCIGEQTPETVKTVLQGEIDKRNALIDAIEAEIARLDAEYAAQLITVPDEVTSYVATI